MSFIGGEAYSYMVLERMQAADRRRVQDGLIAAYSQVPPDKRESGEPWDVEVSHAEVHPMRATLRDLFRRRVDSVGQVLTVMSGTGSNTDVTVTVSGSRYEAPADQEAGRRVLLPVGSAEPITLRVDDGSQAVYGQIAEAQRSISGQVDSEAFRIRREATVAARAARPRRRLGRG